MPLSQTPAYNLKAVLKETGLAADTLRAWERRYGLPRPKRTPGGHRLYSQHDVHLIRWLMARQAEGLSISRAAGLWNELTASGADPLEAAAEDRASPIAAPASLDSLRVDWLAACLRFDEQAADQVLSQAFALYPVERVVHELIQAGLSEIGSLWLGGEASVQQEHFAAGLATRRLDALLAAAPPPARRETVLLACPPEEWHAFPLLVLSLVLRRRGWSTINLGANVPQQRLDETVRTIQPHLVVLSAEGLAGAASLMHAAALIVQNGVPVAFGGRVFNQVPELRQQIAGEFIGESLEQAAGRIDEILEKGAPPASAVSPIRGSLAREYRLKRPLIEAALRGLLDQFGAPEDMEAARLHFGRALAAALDLGEVGYIQADLDWIRSVKRHGASPVEALPAYISAYSQALRTVMGAGGASIADWLDRYASRR